MPVHVFVDESQRREYLLCAVEVEVRHLLEVRRTMRRLLLPGQRRIHFKSESDRRRKVALTQIADLPVRLRIGRAVGPAADARAEAWEALLPKIRAADCQRLVVERRGRIEDRSERRFLASRLGPDSVTEYVHLPPHEEPILWVADAVAWAGGAGRQWHERLALEFA